MDVSEIKLLGSHLEDGESTRVHCPVCVANEKSLSLTRDGEDILYYCFRASCGAAGGTSSRRMGGGNTSVPARKFTPYDGELFELKDDWKDYLHHKVGFTDWHINKSRMLQTADGRVAYPILSPSGIKRGYVIRAYDGREPKALTRMDMAAPHTSYYPCAGSTTFVLVEDIPSAVRASKYATSVALCGTGLTAEALHELAAVTRDVVWALDADATGTAIANHMKNKLYFDSSSVLTLEADFKNLTDKEVQLCLSAL